MSWISDGTAASTETGNEGPAGAGVRFVEPFGRVDFERNGFGSAQSIGQIGHRIGRDQLPATDDDDLVARVLDFRQDMGT